MRGFITLSLCLSFLSWIRAQDNVWKPVEGQLMTRWARDVDPKNVLPEHPRPQMTGREWINLNGLWEVAFSPRDPAENTKYFLDKFQPILVPFPVESALSGVKRRVKPDEFVTYRRKFTLNDKFAGKRILLHFGAVDYLFRGEVNEKTVFLHQGGFDPFTADITDAIKPTGEQFLELRVNDPTDKGTQPRGKQVTKPGGIYYTPTTGIWQTVWLEAVPMVSIKRLKIVTGKDADEIAVEVEVRPVGEEFGVRLTALDNGTIVDQRHGTNLHPITLRPKNPKLWSPDSPHLYDLKVELLQDGRPIDAVQSYFGLRKISLGKDTKGRTVMLLNNKPLFQVGLLDQGFWPDGLYTAPTDAALKFDIEQTKRLGYNMIRKHVKVEPDRWYYWCDKLGLLVWQDMPSGDKNVPLGKPDLVRTRESARTFETQLMAMIDALQSHPCIIVWVVFNEGWGQFDTKRITQETKQYDPSRLVNSASGWNDHAGVGDMHDIHVYPGPDAPPLEEKRAIVLGEFGGLGLKVDGHTWEQNTWGYRGAADSADLTKKYERLLAHAWRLHREKGLSACVYTQTTDVETEANGVYTYDRAVLKMDAARITAVNRGDTSGIPIPITIVPSSEKEAHKYRYTLAKPEENWQAQTYDDRVWTEAPGGFGTRGTPGALVRTEWKSNDIWLRRVVTLPDPMVLKSPHLWIHHDEDAEVYINGVLAAKLTGFSTGYEEAALSAEAAKALKPGKNVIAIHCRQTRGGQYIDLGLIDYK